ncbi:MAG: diacylglycerol kinase family lipid kinase [Anaerovoracaceae bacterium]
MRYVFIINPAAGSGYAILHEENIIERCEAIGITPEIYTSARVGDAERFCKELVSKRGKESSLRIFACGGDGTVNEVINGVYGADNVEVGIIPAGTGNDFVRNFDAKYDFHNIEKQLKGISIDCDLIRYKYLSDGELIQRYCINMFNIGFDSDVVYTTGIVKKSPFIKGSFAYLLSVLIVLFEMRGIKLRIELDNGEVFDKHILLIAIANGCFCGGGVKGVPNADISDGLIDVSIINKISRISFLRLFPKYAKGTHLELKESEKIITYRKVKKLKLSCKSSKGRMSTDGEISIIDNVDFECVPSSIKLILPKI